MAHAVSFPSGAPSEHRNLAFWMQRTLKELANVRSEPTNDGIHDLRVALRRCRSIAAAMEEVDPHPDWKEMRSCARKLFRALGELRDAHVTAEWLDRLHPEEDELKRQMLLALKDGEHLARAKAQRRVASFDQSRWKKLIRSLRSRVRRVPADGEAASCLALERFEEARELHRRALRTENAKPWHALRIGAKHFRYAVESLLPTAHEQWRDSLKRLQEVLGNIHDLDVLAGRLKRMRGQQLEENLQDWQARIENARQENLRTYRQLTLGTTSVWNTWLSGFPRDEWERYANARVRATRAAMDPRSARTTVITRLAMRIWSQLRLQKAAELFSGKNERRLLETAARLSGVHCATGKKSREKSARKFLLKSPVPPRWTFAEWERVAWAVRFQRGADPGSHKKRFALLPPDQQSRICVLAGILRLAIAAQKCGVTKTSALKIEPLPQGLLLHLSGVEDSPRNAARLTEAKQLLERSIGKTLLIQQEPLSQIPEATEESQIASPISIVR